MSLNHLLTEVDRQLGEQTARADAFASKSGLLIATSAVLTGFLAGSTTTEAFSPLLWVVGLAAVLGVFVLCLSRLLVGPATSQIVRWTATVAEQDLFDAKVVTLEANARALTRAEVVFFLQAAMTVVGILLMMGAHYS